MMCSLSHEYGWETDIYYSPPHDTYNELFENIDQNQPDLISFSFKSFERSYAISLAETVNNFLLKSNNMNTKIIAGGIHPTLMPNDVAQTGYFDAVIVGDGIGIWKEILDNYTNFNNGKIIYGKQHPNKTLYTKHFYSKSQINRMKNAETAAVITGIGCPYKCTFCHSGSQKYFPFNIEDVARHILDLYKNYGVRNFHFLDDLFVSNVNRIIQLRKIIEQYEQPGQSDSNIGFSSQVSGRANTFNNEIAIELKKLGVETVNFGIETTSYKLLEFLNKQQSPEQCYNAVNVCREYELNCVVNLMFGIPTQNEDDLKLAFEFVKKSKPDSVNCFYYAPYPGTALYEYCFDNGYLPETYDRNRFDWFISNTEGISNVQLKLNNIDYDLVNEYTEKINRVMNDDKDKHLFDRMKIIDLCPWILIGTTRHYYYTIIIKKLLKVEWKNFLGYINVETESGFSIDSILKDMRYDDNNNNRPLLCVTHSFLGSDFKVIERYIKKKFGNIPLISISSFRRSHSVEDIKNIREKYGT